MKYLVLAFAILLTGCATAPVVMKFPEVPEACLLYTSPSPRDRG